MIEILIEAEMIEILIEAEMIEILIEAERLKKLKGGKPSKLAMEDRLLLTLEYLREYRTYYHIAVSRNINETTVIRVVKWIEDTLTKSNKRKELLEDGNEIEVILVNATESPIERPKKYQTQKKFIQGKRKNTQ
jgi:hypothetical protein